MKNHPIQQEIMLVTSTTFSQRQLSQKEASETCQHLSLTAQIEEACWNGLLKELLPEIIETLPSGKNLYIWNIRPSKYLLQINLSEYPLLLEKEFSIDPCLVLSIISV